MGHRLRVVDYHTYGGKGGHGGEHWKERSQIDWLTAYAARHVAKNLVASGLCKEVLVQLPMPLVLIRSICLSILMVRQLWTKRMVRLL